MNAKTIDRLIIIVNDQIDKCYNKKNGKKKHTSQIIYTMIEVKERLQRVSKYLDGKKPIKKRRKSIFDETLVNDKNIFQ